jgi:hypothetical protein
MLEIRLLSSSSLRKISYYWQAKEFLNGFEKSFKGKWRGEDGVSQELVDSLM